MEEEKKKMEEKKKRMEEENERLARKEKNILKKVFSVVGAGVATVAIVVAAPVTAGLGVAVTLFGSLFQQ